LKQRNALRLLRPTLWIEGQSLRTELRFGAADLDSIRAYAADLTATASGVDR
jgi:hypothetical protein